MDYTQNDKEEIKALLLELKAVIRQDLPDAGELYEAGLLPIKYLRDKEIVKLLQEAFFKGKLSGIDEILATVVEINAKRRQR